MSKYYRLHDSVTLNVCLLLAVMRLQFEPGRDRGEMRDMGKGKKERKDNLSWPVVER